MKSASARGPATQWVLRHAMNRRWRTHRCLSSSSSSGLPLLSPVLCTARLVHAPSAGGAAPPGGSDGSAGKDGAPRSSSGGGRDGSSAAGGGRTRSTPIMSGSSGNGTGDSSSHRDGGAGEAAVAPSGTESVPLSPPAVPYNVAGPPGSPACAGHPPPSVVPPASPLVAPAPSPPNQLAVVRKKSMKMADIRRSAEERVWDSLRHTRDRLPKTDDEGLLLCFSQGTTDYCWRAIPHRQNVKEPRMLRSETMTNRVRLFGMPKGYPDTTAFGFQRFFYLSQASSFVSNFSSSIGYQSLLNGFFLGSSPQLWMLKDLIPALLAAYLANKVVSYENRPKFWFAVSVFMNNVSVISDMLIPKLFPQHLLVAAIITSTVKQSSALMYFVTRAAALQHFATHNNLAELTKKFNSFGMVNYTIATALGIAYCTYVASFTVQLVTAVVCCALNMVLAPMSMNPIAFRILNFTTIQLVMHSYVKHGKILSPDAVSQKLGVRMVAQLPEDEADRHSLIYVSPPIDKLVIRSDTLDEDVLYVSDNGLFMIGLWEPSPVPLTIRECWLRWELPKALRVAQQFESFRRTFRKGSGTRKAEMVFGGKRLVLLVHTKCTARDLITAYLIMFTATLKHATTELQLRTFVRDCHKDQATWRRDAAALRESLRLVDWDVNLLSIDHPNFRMSDMIVPPSMRPPRSSSTAHPAQAPSPAQPSSSPSQV